MPRCPKCRIPTDRIKYEGVTIYNCGSCGGHWLNHARLDVILKRREVVMPEPVKQKMMDLADASNTTEPLLCLTCGTQMVKETFRWWDDIVLDRCPKCNGLWLDRGELEKCQIYWEYAQDHPEAWEQPALERRAALEARLAAHRQKVRDAAASAGRLDACGVARMLASLFFCRGWL